MKEQPQSNTTACATVLATAAGSVPILEMRGDIKFGSDGGFFALGGLENLRFIVGSIRSGKQSGDGFSIQFVRYGCYDVTLNRDDLEIMHVFCSVVHDIPLIPNIFISHEITAPRSVRFHTNYEYYDYDNGGQRIPGSSSFDYIESDLSFLIMVKN